MLDGRLAEAGISGRRIERRLTKLEVERMGDRGQILCTDDERISGAEIAQAVSDDVAEAGQVRK